MSKQDISYRHVRHRRAKSKRKFTVLLVSLFLVLAIGIGATLAYIFTNTGSIVNEFSQSKVSLEIDETFDGMTKEDVGVKNTGESEVYIRAALNITWLKDGDADDQTVTAEVPKKDVDYTIIFEENSGWIDGEDGYWYYSKPVAAGRRTENLIKECKLIDGVKAPDGYNLSVEIVAQAIQSTPKTTVEDSWNVTVDDISKLLTPTK